jgi:hypothetical protein
MIPWILDDGPFGTLALFFDSAWKWPPATLHVVREVASGARTDRSGRLQLLLSMMNAGQPCISVHDIQEGTPAAEMLYGYLRTDSTHATKDLGEDASIAFCAMVRPDALFVTQDRAAALVALAELGPGRVATPFDLWHGLEEKALISRDQCQALCAATYKSAKNLLPGVPRRILKPYGTTS